MTEDPKKPPGVGDARTAAFEAEGRAPQNGGAPRLKVRKIGNSLGVVLPKEVLALLKAGEGDLLVVSPTPEGVTLARAQTDIRAQVEAGRLAMQRYRNALRELAK